ncbi:MAG: hypothetical protein WD740_07790 [Anaerolineales bacterium]
MTESSPGYNPSWKIWPLAFGALLTVFGTVSILSWLGWLRVPETAHQAMVHDMGSQVMPFDLSLTTHIFEMTDYGGIQQVIADDPNNSAQISLIQQHIRHEAMRFSQGDFSDPASLHGDDMPGVQDLAESAAQITVEYTALPNGAQITFTTQDLPLITAIHRWFGAQLSDHGADATYR